MKNIYLSIIVLLVAATAQAQVPQAFSYQAVIRNTSNALVANQLVNERISLVKDSATGTVAYSELQSVKTNANGLVSLQIGTGSVLSVSFSSINWATGTYFIKTETDPTGGSKYTISNTTQLLSVPYALQAGSAPSLQYPDGLANAIPVIIDSAHNSYTVPTGKNFYLSYTPDDFSIKIDTDTLGLGSPTQLFILGSGHVIKSVSQQDNYWGLQIYNPIYGYIVDKSVSPIYVNLSKGSYLVPDGKIFVLLGISYPTNLLYGVGVAYINGFRTDYNVSGVQNSILLPSGTVLSGTGVINGYLK